MMLPGLDGVRATEEIMAFSPTPIVIVSASQNRGEALTTFEALTAGAVDVLDKPVGDEVDDRWERALVATVRRAARIKVITHPRAKLRKPGASGTGSGTSSGTRGGGGAVPERAADVEERPPSRPASRRAAPRLVAVGTSTGGPPALVAILAALPADFPLPILLVNHIAPSFAASFVDWLGGYVRLPVRAARDGEPAPQPGRGEVLVAPAERHLVLRGGRVALTADPERHSCRPSVDALFESVAREVGDGAVACLLTGMGKDGAEGLLAVRRAGGHTIAQDEATSAVFGMPREAIRLGAAVEVLPLGRIGAALEGLAARARRSERP
jgi:two-component system chemotaxis response regulator CheB